jgi:hypothetical protein
MTIWTRRSLVTAVAGVLLGVNVAFAQDPPPPPTPQTQTQTPPAGRGQRPGRPNLPAGGPTTQQQLQDYFEIQTILVAERELQVGTEQSPTFMARLRTLQQVRRRHMQQRNRLLGEMRQLVQGAGPYRDDLITEKLKAYDDFNQRAAQELRQAELEFDGVLAPWQRVRFRMIEERLDRQKLELLIKLREGGRGGGGRAAAPQPPQRRPGLRSPAH